MVGRLLFIAAYVGVVGMIGEEDVTRCVDEHGQEYQVPNPMHPFFIPGQFPNLMEMPRHGGTLRKLESGEFYEIPTREMAIEGYCRFGDSRVLSMQAWALAAAFNLIRKVNIELVCMHLEDCLLDPEVGIPSLLPEVVMPKPWHVLVRDLRMQDDFPENMKSRVMNSVLRVMRGQEVRPELLDSLFRGLLAMDECCMSYGVRVAFREGESRELGRLEPAGPSMWGSGRGRTCVMGRGRRGRGRLMYNTRTGKLVVKFLPEQK